MSNEIKRRPEMNLIAIDVDQFLVFSIIKLIDRFEKIELGWKLVSGLGRGKKV